MKPGDKVRVLKGLAGNWGKCEGKIGRVVQVGVRGFWRGKTYAMVSFGWKRFVPPVFAVENLEQVDAHEVVPVVPEPTIVRGPW